MKLNQLRDFVAVAEQGSLRGAARALGHAQPAITRSVRELEHTLGAQLFIREARGVRLTAVGQEFLVHAASILGDVRRARESVSQKQGEVEGELVVGFSISAHLGIFTKVLRGFQQRYPKVRLRVIEGFLPTLEPDLRTGALDFYVGPAAAATHVTELQITKLFDNRRYVVGRRGHPLKGESSLEALLQASWMSTSVTHIATDELSVVFEKRGLPAPEVVCQCQSALSVLSVMANSDLLAMMPVQWIESPLVRDWLEIIHPDLEFSAPDIVLAHRAGIGFTPAAEYFVDLICRTANPDGVMPDSGALSGLKR